MQIRAATSGTRDAEPLWTPLLTFEAGNRDAVKVLGGLTEVIAQAEQQPADSPGKNREDRVPHSAGNYRPVPGPSEQTWSKHGLCSTDYVDLGNQHAS